MLFKKRKSIDKQEAAAVKKQCMSFQKCGVSDELLKFILEFCNFVSNETLQTDAFIPFAEMNTSNVMFCTLSLKKFLFEHQESFWFLMIGWRTIFFEDEDLDFCKYLMEKPNFWSLLKREELTCDESENLIKIQLIDQHIEITLKKFRMDVLSCLNLPDQCIQLMLDYVEDRVSLFYNLYS